MLGFIIGLMVGWGGCALMTAGKVADLEREASWAKYQLAEANALAGREEDE